MPCGSDVTSRLRFPEGRLVVSHSIQDLPTRESAQNPYRRVLLGLTAFEPPDIVSITEDDVFI